MNPNSKAIVGNCDRDHDIAQARPRTVTDAPKPISVEDPRQFRVFLDRQIRSNEHRAAEIRNGNRRPPRQCFVNERSKAITAKIAQRSYEISDDITEPEESVPPTKPPKSESKSSRSATAGDTGHVTCTQA
jgi:hypothetical protein